jgi:hypothetical protein
MRWYTSVEWQCVSQKWRPAQIPTLSLVSTPLRWKVHLSEDQICLLWMMSPDIVERLHPNPRQTNHLHASQILHCWLLNTQFDTYTKPVWLGCHHRNSIPMMMMMFRRIPADLFENTVTLIPELLWRSLLLKSLSLLLVRVVLNSLLGFPFCFGLIHRGRLPGFEE